MDEIKYTYVSESQQKWKLSCIYSKNLFYNHNHINICAIVFVLVEVKKFDVKIELFLLSVYLVVSRQFSSF